MKTSPEEEIEDIVKSLQNHIRVFLDSWKYLHPDKDHNIIYQKAAEYAVYLEITGFATKVHTAALILENMENMLGNQS